jgi:4-hydroxybenzoate polyprenyltransferase
MARITETIRAVEWWEYKLSPLFATLYATAYLLSVSVFSLWPLLVLALVALVSCAAYVSVINDLTDRADDAASSKTNRLAGRSRAFVGLLLVCCVAPGAMVAFRLRDDLLLLILYFGAWAAFSLYSIPPARLKNRGFPGVLADASGAHLFPSLFVAALVFRSQKMPVDLLWLASVAVWSLSYGLRGILWHQLNDLQNDELIGLRTFACRFGPARLRRLGAFVIFPLEMAALAFMLAQAGSSVAIAFLFLYAALEVARKLYWNLNFVIVAPRLKYRVVMLEYYEFFYPLAFLLSSSLKHPADALILFAHFLLFPRRLTLMMIDTMKATKIIGKRLLLKSASRKPTP